MNPRLFMKVPVFAFALLPSVLFYAVVIPRNWIPIHDAYQISNIVYFLFNEVAKHHEVPLWYPYISYGVDANWYLVIALGPSLASVLPIAGLLGRGDALVFYYVSLFLDEIILLVGTYLLARTLFRGRLTVLFVCLAMTGSTLWYAQPWFDFHLYYFVPLSAYFIVTGAARGEMWRFMAGAFAVLISEFGNLPYFFVPHALTFALLALGASWAYRFEVGRAWRRAGVREWAALVACGLTAGLYVLFLAYGVDHINYNVGRTRILVDPEGFLAYGGAIGLQKFAELFTGTSWDIDINVYAGVLVSASALLGLLRAPERRMAPFLLTAVFLTMLSLGKDTFVAPLLYDLPGVAYYRHVGLVVPLVKVMLIVLAGFGFDTLVDPSTDANAAELRRKRTTRLTAAAILALMLGAGLVMIYQAAWSIKATGFQSVFPVLTHASSGFYGRLAKFVERELLVVGVYLAAIGVLLAASGWPKVRVAVIGTALLVIQGLDVYSYRTFQFEDHMVPIDAAYRQLFAFADQPFAAERTEDPMTDRGFRTAASHFSKSIPSAWYTNCATAAGVHCYWNFANTPEGVYYDTLEPFVGMDPCRSVLRTDYWLPGVDLLYRALAGLPLHDLGMVPRGYEHRTIYFPIFNTALRKIIACEVPKFQVFSSVSVLDNEGALAGFLRDPRFNGDLLLATRADYAPYAAAARDAAVSAVDPNVDGRATTRVHADARIIGAAANWVTVRTMLPASEHRYWLYFADAWHPFWRAYVNGRRAPILRSYFGFKAVEVPGGPATVTFAYRSKVLTIALLAAGLLLISTMVAVLVAAARFLIPRVESGAPAASAKR